jgi:hypothetical protein
MYLWPDAPPSAGTFSVSSIAVANRDDAER